ncbi:putative membrane protein YkoI [Sinobaca qinghaiensis]|uniref:Putative membrane protein YkoI n=1 Tax=Sinobaca qinghaiensis TaxID=342944 RepID=A0A419V466_9BACL|nr:PepSY domain-containing protein [Sinobaca qinghaiensis]RKD73319.1 putative membrane protein YkoI [Sinobaca qinghaiensis]
MKKLIIITLCIIAIGAVAVGVQMFSASADDPSLNSEEAKELAASRYPGEVTVIELNNESGEQIYTMEIDGNDNDYRLKLNADSGDVVELSEITNADSQEEASEESAADTASEPEPAAEESSSEEASPAEEESSRETGSSSNQLPISMDDAKSIALEEVGGGSVTDIELDDDDGRVLYELEIVSSQGEVDVDVDARTGEIIVISYD